MFILKKFIVWFLEWFDGLLDYIPTYEEGRWYRHGCWGCRFKIALYSATLDERWGTGHWKPVDEDGIVDP